MFQIPNALELAKTIRTAHEEMTQGLTEAIRLEGARKYGEAKALANSFRNVSPGWHPSMR